MRTYMTTLLQSNQQDSDDESEPDCATSCPKAYKVAMEMFGKCLTWLQHQSEASSHKTGVLLSLKEKADKKRLSLLKQTTMPSFLKKKIFCFVMCAVRSLVFVDLFQLTVNNNFTDANKFTSLSIYSTVVISVVPKVFRLMKLSHVYGCG